MVRNLATRDEAADVPTKGDVDGHDHSGVYEPDGAADTAVSTHEAAGDPHAGYLLESAHDKAAHDALDIDADTVDGQHAAAFAAAGHDHDGSYATSGHAHSTAMHTVVQSGTGQAVASRPSGVSNGQVMWLLYDEPSGSEGIQSNDLVCNISGTSW